MKGLIRTVLALSFAVAGLPVLAADVVHTGVVCPDEPGRSGDPASAEKHCRPEAEPASTTPAPEQLPPATPTEAKSAPAETAPAPIREPAPAAVVPVPPVAPTPPEAAKAVPPAPQPVEAPLHVTLDAKTHFGFDQYLLNPSGQAQLDQLLAYLAQRQFETIVITGHTDRLGSKAYNETLSDQRALSVKEYLTQRGVDAQKIQTRGAGGADPVTLPGACEGLDRAKMIQCLAPDRRVELEVTGVHQR